VARRLLLLVIYQYSSTLERMVASGNEECVGMAAASGNLEVLKYAERNGCDGTLDTCSNAAIAGNLEMLKYAHEMGCEWARQRARGCC